MSVESNDRMIAIQKRIEANKKKAEAEAEKNKPVIANNTPTAPVKNVTPSVVTKPQIFDPDLGPKKTTPTTTTTTTTTTNTTVDALTNTNILLRKEVETLTNEKKSLGEANYQLDLKNLELDEKLFKLQDVNTKLGDELTKQAMDRTRELKVATEEIKQLNMAVLAKVDPIVHRTLQDEFKLKEKTVQRLMGENMGLEDELKKLKTANNSTLQAENDVLKKQVTQAEAYRKIAEDAYDLKEIELAKMKNTAHALQTKATVQETRANHAEAKLVKYEKLVTVIENEVTAGNIVSKKFYDDEKKKHLAASLQQDMSTLDTIFNRGQISFALDAGVVKSRHHMELSFSNGAMATPLAMTIKEFVKIGDPEKSGTDNLIATKFNKLGAIHYESAPEEIRRNTITGTGEMKLKLIDSETDNTVFEETYDYSIDRTGGEERTYALRGDKVRLHVNNIGNDLFALKMIAISV